MIFINPNPLDERLNEVNSPYWDEGGQIHNWQNYVGQNVRKIWSTLTDEIKNAIALDADAMAEKEEWD